MEKTTSVEEYIESEPVFQKELEFLREVLLSTELEETIKWGGPCYVINGKTVVGLGAFKSHVALWFNQGVFMKDPHHKLVNANEGVTKGLRQWRFSSVSEMDKHQIREYVLEAIRNEKEGKRIKAEKKKWEVAQELEDAFKKDKKLKAAFDLFTPGKQGEFLEYILTAKRAETRLSRIEKITPMIMAGVGLNDKYRS